MTAKLRVVFAGTPQNAAETLERLVSEGVQIVGVLTRTDARVGRSGELTPSAVAQKAHELGLETFKTNNIDDKAIEWLISLRVDIGAVVAYGSIFKQPVLEMPRLGWLNLHYSLLPELPGPAPVQHAILQGRKITGVTVFRLESGVDSGPIISSKEQAIDDADTTGSLLSKLTENNDGNRLADYQPINNPYVNVRRNDTMDSNSYDVENENMNLNPTELLPKTIEKQPSQYSANEMNLGNYSNLMFFIAPKLGDD
jgi:methionyl-tRNA formyltransferase